MIPKFRFYHLTENEMYEVNSIRLCQKQVECFPKGHKFSFVTYEEDEGIIMQSTGLFDKNGKEIFEGHILNYRDEYRVVEMYDGAWIARTGEKRLIVKMAVLSGAEIIGNKFENRELLDYDSE